MSIATIIEIAIGILSVWIVVSFITVLVQPWVSSRLREQASDLERAIQRMLAHPLLIAQFYDHPIIRSLAADRGRVPSHIPARQFALVIFDILQTVGSESALIQHGIFKLRNDLLREKKRPVPLELIEELNTLAELARSTATTETGMAITKASLEVLKEEAFLFIEKFRMKYPKTKIDWEMELQLQQGIKATFSEASKLKLEMDEVTKKQRIKSSDYTFAVPRLRLGAIRLSVLSLQLSQTLLALLLNVEDYVTPRETSIGRAQRNVEKWFEDSMASKSSDLKRFSQALAFFIGFILALLLNIDSINMALYFWRDAALREALVQNSAQFVNSNPESLSPEEFSQQLVSLELPFGWAINKSTSAAYLDQNCQLFPGDDKAFGIPFFASSLCMAPSHLEDQTNILLKFVGILITAFAARQGAPYWFDLLKVLLSLPRGGQKAAT